MTETRVPYVPETVTPPGATIAELLAEQGMTQKELALRMGRPQKTINEIIKGKAAITPDTALQLEKIFETPADYWLTHEAHYRAFLARRTEEQDLAASAASLEWLNRMPVRELKERGYLPNLQNRGRNKLALLQSLLRFFAVAAPEDWERVYGRLPACYRRSQVELSDPYAMATWLRLGELQAMELPVKQFDREQFLSVLAEMRNLTVLPPAQFIPQLQSMCAEVGVVVAIVPALPRARISGAARRYGGRPLIELSLYGKTNDRFWFTFFHEAAHVLYHSQRMVYLDDGGDGSAEEREANAFAADLLIPPSFNTELATLRSKHEVLSFAERIGIHPGIVVGRLQHQRIIDQSWMNELKETIDYHVGARQER